MDIKKLILNKLNKEKEIKVATVVKATGFSRAYINRFFRELQEKNIIIHIGKANRSQYVLADKKSIYNSKKKILDIRKKLTNINLTEDSVLDEIKQATGIFIDLKENIKKIIDYTFTELLNNAIEHSKSKNIEILMDRNNHVMRFIIIDKGIGIFNNIRHKKRLKNNLEAIQDLLKGKQTTAPKNHSGEGIFFSSKAGDVLIIEGTNKRIIFNNIIDDVFIQDIKNRVGTKVILTISLNSKKNLSKIFNKYSENTYEFSKTQVNIKLYKMGTIYISRSQARRVLVGLDNFKTVIFDFKNVKTVGQGFADEVFRVWQQHNSKIKIIIRNSNENINFMIKHIQKTQ